MEYDENADKKLEIEIEKWTNIINGWKRRYLIIDSQFLHLVKSKTLSLKDNIKSFRLNTIKVFDDPKRRQIVIQNHNKKLFCRLIHDEDRGSLIEIINICISHLGDQPPNQISLNDPNELISVNRQQMALITEQIDRFGCVLSELMAMKKHVDKKKHDSFKEAIEKLFISQRTLHENMLALLSEAEKSTEKSSQPLNKPSKGNSFHIVEKTAPIEDSNIKEIVNANYSNEENNDSSSEEEIEEEVLEGKISHEKIRQSMIIKTKFERSLSRKLNDFLDDSYFNLKANPIPLRLKVSPNIISDIMKASTKKNASLPIIYNEPISMLQRQCEKFFYSSLLIKASDLSIPLELKLCYLAGFIVGEVSQSINRFLKPFNPILGETYEFFDNQLQYRYFSEQVSHKPPISAFICESSDFVVFGDTRYKSAFKILKGAMELESTTKTHILFKKDNNLAFAYTKPKAYLKGVVSGALHYDFGGKVVIECLSDVSVRAEINFIEDSAKKDIDSIEGAVYKNNDIVYQLKGR